MTFIGPAPGTFELSKGIIGGQRIFVGITLAGRLGPAPGTFELSKGILERRSAMAPGSATLNLNLCKLKL